MELLVALSNPPLTFRRLALEGPSAGKRRKPEFERQHQTHLDPGSRHELLARYGQGEPVDQLAAEFGVHRATVFAMAKRATVRRNSKHLSAAEQAEAVRLYALGWSCMRVGQELNRSGGAVRRALLQAGVTMRDNRGRERI